MDSLCCVPKSVNPVNVCVLCLLCLAAVCVCISQLDSVGVGVCVHVYVCSERL